MFRRLDCALALGGCYTPVLVPARAKEDRMGTSEDVATEKYFIPPLEIKDINRDKKFFEIITRLNNQHRQGENQIFDCGELGFIEI